MSGTSPPRKDLRLPATAIIAFASLGMMALAVPLGIFADAVSLAYLTVAGSALSILGVWAFGRPKDPGIPEKKVAQLQATIDSLKERVEHVEVMGRFESALAEKESPPSKSAATPAGDHFPQTIEESQ